MDIVVIETPALGDRSYVVVSDGIAAVIDPQRDIDRIESVIAERHVQVTHVFETHVHNDYVTGGLELARKSGALYVVSSSMDLAFEHVSADEGAEFEVGEVVIKAIATPGHTPDHRSYAVIDNGRPTAVFSGGSMLFGTVGRTDLISDDATEELTRAQFRSVRRLANELPADAAVHPTHGFGSFCSSASSSGSDALTIVEERDANMALTTYDEDAFVTQLLDGLTAHPRYYVHMAPINSQGPAPVDLSDPEPVDPVEIRRRIHAGEWVVDLRSRTAFADGHLFGTVNLEAADSFATYLGWVMPWDTPVTLVGDNHDEVDEAQRQMVRIGIDRPAGRALGGIETWGLGGERRSFRTATFAELAKEIDPGETVVVDVRRDDEWAEGHVTGATHIPVHDLDRRLDEIPDGDIWVYCASGYRAALAASLIDRSGRTVIAVDDEWDTAPDIGTLQVAKS
ncbi:MBL fold metallo-hydrolase [soil metagenome]